MRTTPLTSRPAASRNLPPACRASSHLRTPAGFTRIPPHAISQWKMFIVEVMELRKWDLVHQLTVTQLYQYWRYTSICSMLFIVVYRKPTPSFTLLSQRPHPSSPSLNAITQSNNVLTMYTMSMAWCGQQLVVCTK